MRRIAIALLVTGASFAQTTAVNGPGSGGTVVSSAPPYFNIGGTKYVAATGFLATLPGTPSWVNSTIPSTVSTGTNGNVFAGQATAGTFFSQATASSSVEGEFSCIAGATYTSTPFCGIWIFDSTNSFIYTLNVQESGASGLRFIGMAKYTWNGSTAATYSADVGTAFDFGLTSDPLHYKLSVSAGTLSAQISLDGGKTFWTWQTVGSIGTITKGGYDVGNDAFINVFSIVIN